MQKEAMTTHGCRGGMITSSFPVVRFPQMVRDDFNSLRRIVVGQILTRVPKTFIFLRLSAVCLLLTDSSLTLFDCKEKRWTMTGTSIDSMTCIVTLPKNQILFSIHSKSCDKKVVAMK